MNMKLGTRVAPVVAVVVFIRSLAEHFNQFSSSLASMIGGIVIAADRLARTGEELEANMGTVAAAVTEIAANVKEMKEGADRQSMNASIKAAHAGEFCKGFAVLADEIRNLAEGSTDQSTRIGSSIERIQASIANVVTSSNPAVMTFTDVRSRINSLHSHQDEHKHALIEQKEGSATALQALAAIREATSEVDSAAREMCEARAEVVSRMSSLVADGDEFSRGVAEMADGAAEIDHPVVAASDLTRMNRDNMGEVAQVARAFKIT